MPWRQPPRNVVIVDDRFRHVIRKRNHPGASERAPGLYLSLWSKCMFLSDDAEAIDWVNIIQSIQKEPSVASFCDYELDNMVLLHFICALRAPLDVVVAALDAHPDAVKKQSVTEGITPLMVACGRNASTDVIRRLLQHQGKETIRLKNREGYSAIHYACRDDVLPTVLRQLLIVDPTVAHAQVIGTWAFASGDTPTDILMHTVVMSRTMEKTIASEKLCYVLRARHYGTIISRNGTQSTLHAALAIPTVRGLFVWYTMRHEGLANAGVRDVMGNLPLHYAVQRPPPTAARLAKAQTTHLLEILELFEAGAGCKDSSGRYPLHVALENGHTWWNGIQYLFTCHPAAIKVKDVATGLYPFALAAGHSDLETTFCILRENPDFVAAAVKTTQTA